MAVYRILTVLAVYALFILSPGDCNAECKTEACGKTAKRILNYMDPDVSPCDDFYRFTCGNMLKAELPKGKDRWSSFDQVQEVVDARMRSFLEEPIEPKEPVGYKAAKKFYTLCLDDQAESNATEASFRLRSAGWPVLGDWKEEQWSIHDHEKSLKDFTLSGGGLFHVNWERDSQRPGKAQITVEQPTLTRQFLQEWGTQEDFIDSLELPHVKTYHDYMVDLAVMFGADRQSAVDQLRESLRFELDLEEIIDTPVGRHRPYQMMTQSELQSRFAKVDWSALLAATVVPRSIEDGELVKVYEPDYLDRLSRLIEQHSKRAIANFMGWRAAERMSLMLTPEMVARKNKFDEKVGLEVKEPWERCVELVSNSYLSLAVSSMYAKRYMHEETKSAVKEMTTDLRNTMYSVIKRQTDWMDDGPKTSALLKLCKMREYIGYPKELTDPEKIDELYDGLDLAEFTDFFHAEIQINDFMENGGIFRFLLTEWVPYGMAAAMVNAMYSPNDNALQLTAAILQPPFFSASLPRYMYYSTMGMVAGHEITHGFDNHGVEYDADGRRKNWFDESSKMNYEEKGECILNQYVDYVDTCNSTANGGPIPYLPGNDSLGEIIADNGGLKLAYLAYKGFSEQLDDPEPLLPDLEQFTSDQMFFIGLGNLWCFQVDREKVKSVKPKDRHPPAEFRINGVFKNFPQFGEAFKCEAGSNMNPKGKCSVW